MERQSNGIRRCRVRDALSVGNFFITFDPATKLGPLVSAAQRERVRGFITTGISEGDRLVAGGVWSADQDRAVAFARQVRTGPIDVNGGAYNPLVPFGGYKPSGLGREMGRLGLDEFLKVRSIQL